MKAIYHTQQRMSEITETQDMISEACCDMLSDHEQNRQSPEKWPGHLFRVYVTLMCCLCPGVHPAVVADIIGIGKQNPTDTAVSARQRCFDAIVACMDTVRPTELLALMRALRPIFAEIWSTELITQVVPSRAALYQTDDVLPPDNSHVPFKYIPPIGICRTFVPSVFFMQRDPNYKQRFRRLPMPRPISSAKVLPRPSSAVLKPLGTSPASPITPLVPRAIRSKPASHGALGTSTSCGTVGSSTKKGSRGPKALPEDFDRPSHRDLDIVFRGEGEIRIRAFRHEMQRPLRPLSAKEVKQLLGDPVVQ